ncbi:hypothetical protein D3C76_1803410 [compost metagenome]
MQLDLIRLWRGKTRCPDFFYMRLGKIADAYAACLAGLLQRDKCAPLVDPLVCAMR